MAEHLCYNYRVFHCMKAIHTIYSVHSVRQFIIAHLNLRSERTSVLAVTVRLKSGVAVFDVNERPCRNSIFSLTFKNVNF